MTLQVGFPEMRLSAEVVGRLRGRRDRPATPVGDGPVFKPESPDETMLSHLATMDAFLQAQRAVMGGLLSVGPVGLDEPSVPSVEPMEAPNDFRPPSPGPWAGGRFRRIVPGREVEAIVTLDALGDPVAEHHTFGGRRLSSVHPSMKGLPVLPFTVMAEMLVDVAARLAPGKALIGLRDVRARRWVRYEDGPIPLEIVAKANPEQAGQIHAALFNRGKAGLGDSPEVEAIVALRWALGVMPPISATAGLERPEPSRFTARSMYAEQWLFHGPALRAVAEVGGVSEGGIDGTLRVLPRCGLYRDPSSPRPLTDPIVLDAFTHLLGLWGLDRLSEGDVVFPLRLGRLDVFGDDPPEGSDCPCLIRVKTVGRSTLTVDAEVLRPDGRVWMRLTDWDDWRFYWPPRYRDVFRSPDHIFVGEPLDLAGVSDAVAVWLEPPADMGRPVWRDVLEKVQLSPEERAGCLKPTGHDGRRSLRLWGRIAAKEAVRRLWSAAGGSPIFPADLTIEPDDRGRPVLRSRAQPDDETMPAVSIAHTAGVAVAIASTNPGARVGIDVEKVVDRGASFEAIAFSSRGTDAARPSLTRRAGRVDRAILDGERSCGQDDGSRPDRGTVKRRGRCGR